MFDCKFTESTGTSSKFKWKPRIYSPIPRSQKACSKKGAKGTEETSTFLCGVFGTLGVRRGGGRSSRLKAWHFQRPS
eukprot:3932234-Amphidinium_carterae.1